LKDVAANSVSVEPYSSSTFISGKATAQEKVINSVSVQNVGMISVLGFGLACSDSQAAFFKTNEENVLIGISLYNTQVQPIGVSPDKKTNAMYFSRYVEDCVGTFSTGSWMGK
uniref:Peptidase A1 domain-containing protein n=1 Tax=Heligmosomoides polygyrus TaxID=6339 RepID=A0A183GX48_HELPZ